MRALIFTTILSFFIILGGFEYAGETSVPALDVPTYATLGSVLGDVPDSVAILEDVLPSQRSVVRGSINVPGLKPLDNYEIPVYFYDIDERAVSWSAVTVTDYSRKSCAQETPYIAVLNRRYQKDVLYNELYNAAFDTLLAQEGIVYCPSKDVLWFDFLGERYTKKQLDEAASEIGSIRGAYEDNAPERAKERISGLRYASHPNYALSKTLVERSLGDPRQYSLELEKAIEVFLATYRNRG